MSLAVPYPPPDRLVEFSHRHSTDSPQVCYPLGMNPYYSIAAVDRPAVVTLAANLQAAVGKIARELIRREFGDPREDPEFEVFELEKPDETVVLSTIDADDWT